MADPAIDVDIDEPESTPDPEPSEHPWGEDWRENYAGEDEKKLAYATKYASPTAALDAGLAAQFKISTGEFVSTDPFPGEGTEKEQEAWRKDDGIPKDAKGYELGREIEEGHQTSVDSILEFAHARNLSPEAAKVAIDYYHENDQQTKEWNAEQDEKDRLSAEDELRAEWGPDYRSNINRINAFLDTAQEGVKDNILNARMPDGTPFCSNPDAMRFLIDSALMLQDKTTLVHMEDSEVKSLIDEMNDIRSKMNTDEYRKGPKGEAMQKRYTELLSMKLGSEGKLVDQ